MRRKNSPEKGFKFLPLWRRQIDFIRLLISNPPFTLQSWEALPHDTATFTPGT